MRSSSISENLAKILLLLGELSQCELPKLQEASSDTGIPLGRILVICQRLTEEELESALTAAKLVCNNQLSLSKAAILLAYSYFWHLPFKTIWQRTDFKNANTIAMLLVASGFLHTTKLMELSHDRSSTSVGGQELYEAGIITWEKWKDAVEQAIQIKERELSLRQILCETQDAAATLELTPVKVPVPLAERLGYLLYQAELITDHELISALEMSLESGEPLGKVLRARSVISPLALQTALKLQALVRKNSISASQAVAWLRCVPKAEDTARQEEAVAA